MIVTRDLENLYLNSWEFNSARIITRLAELVVIEGGRVKPTNRATIHHKTHKEIKPLVVSHITYISFVIGDTYYYYQTDDNPFFDFWYLKHRITGGKIPRNGYIKSDDKKWLLNAYVNFDCTDSEILEAAKHILEMLKDSTHSKSGDWAYLDVPNTYDGGFHKEKVWKCEMKKLDF